MSGPRHCSRPLFLRAVAILVEARGEVEQAEGHMATLLTEEDCSAWVTLVASIKEAIQKAFTAKDHEEFVATLGQAEVFIRQCLELMERVSFLPTTEWHHQRQLAMDWLNCSLGRFKVVTTLIRVDQVTGDVRQRLR